jgi:hypothetical protein
MKTTNANLAVVTVALLKTGANRTLSLTAACALLTLAASCAAQGQTRNPGVVDPDQSYAGKTYSEWATAFWQYYASLPTTDNPFERPTGYPIAPLGTGQNGPVWFLCGNFLPGGYFTYTDTVPGGVALFTAVALDEFGNDRCDGITYTEAQMRANAASRENAVTGMTVTIDGVAVNFIDDVMTSPYRVQSTFFDYTCPSIHNVLYGVLGRLCYPPGDGTPYTINGAVVDGVFLMLTPLSAGQHTVQGSFNIPSVTSELWIRTLNVLPVTLTISAGSSAGSVALSWPQTPDTYTVETADALNPQQWWPATNLTATLSNGVWQASTPMGTSSQFFRLRMN